jgi:TolA-binding protein
MASPISLRYAALWYGCSLLVSPIVFSQEATTQPASEAVPRGSVVEDRAARKLLEAGDLRETAGESEKAMEIWQSVIERYPRSRVRFAAYLKLGDFFLNKQRAFDRARTNFEMAASADNPDPAERAQAMLKLGISFAESRLHGKAFATFRDLIELFPNSPEVNRAWYHIGLGHFKQGHYSRAIEALEKVGTNLGEGDATAGTIEAGKRLYVRIEDQDLALLEQGESVKVNCRTPSGDTETVDCLPLGRNTAVVLGSVPTKLGAPAPQDGVLQVHGGELVEIVYTDEFTAKHQLKEKRISQVSVVGSAQVKLVDGSYADSLDSMVIGKTAHLQIVDADFDRSAQADQLTARVEVWQNPQQRLPVRFPAATLHRNVTKKSTART